VLIIPALGAGFIRLLAPLTLRLRGSLLGIFQVVGAIAPTMFLGFAAEELGLEFTVLAAKVLNLFLQLLKALAGSSMHALPIADLLTQFQVLPP
jgi:hypothetical protein